MYKRFFGTSSSFDVVSYNKCCIILNTSPTEETCEIICPVTIAMELASWTCLQENLEEHQSTCCFLVIDKTWLISKYRILGRILNSFMKLSSEFSWNFHQLEYSCCDMKLSSVWRMMRLPSSGCSWDVWHPNIFP